MKRIIKKIYNFSRMPIYVIYIFFILSLIPISLFGEEILDEYFTYSDMKFAIIILFYLNVLFFSLFRKGRFHYPVVLSGIVFIIHTFFDSTNPLLSEKILTIFIFTGIGIIWLFIANILSNLKKTISEDLVLRRIFFVYSFILVNILLVYLSIYVYSFSKVGSVIIFIFGVALQSLTYFYFKKRTLKLKIVVVVSIILMIFSGMTISGWIAVWTKISYMDTPSYNPIIIYWKPKTPKSKFLHNYRIAKEFDQKDNFKKAFIYYKKATHSIKLNDVPYDIEDEVVNAYLKIAEYYEDEGKTDKAKEYLLKVTDFRTANAKEVNLKLAKIYYKEKDMDNAFRYGCKAIREKNFSIYKDGVNFLTHIIKSIEKKDKNKALEYYKILFLERYY